MFERDVARFGAARVASSWRPGAGGTVGPLRHRTDVERLDLPGPGWVRLSPRLSGICGSDLTTVDGRSSRWFEAVVSMPFVPGHEVVADVADGPEAGRRVVVEPVLGCAARGIDPPCPACAAGHLGNCERLAHGCLDAGLQTGFCCDTGGGWATEMLAHSSQLHDVPDDLDDAAAVMVEPTACAVHGALAAAVGPREAVAVIGAGTMGLGVVAALARWTPPAHTVVAAKHPHQRRLAGELFHSQCGAGTGDRPGGGGDGGDGPDDARFEATGPEGLLRAVRRATGSMVLGEGGHERATGGVDVTIDCVGSPESLRTALAVTRPRGRVVLIGMPGVTTVDLTPLWQREISVTGAYTYGVEELPSGPRRTFDLAFELVAAAGLGRLVSATYPLSRSADAIAHAAEAGRRGAVKVAFAPNAGDPRRRPRKDPG